MGVPIGTVWGLLTWADDSWKSGSWADAKAAAVVVNGKYKAEHDSALVDVGQATGFSSEHASALVDVGNAGV